MERFGRGVAMSWRVNNIKTEEQGGEEESRTGNIDVPGQSRPFDEFLSNHQMDQEMLFNLTSDIDVPGQSRLFDELLFNHEMDQEMLFNLTSDIDVPGQSRPFDELLSNHQMDQEMATVNSDQSLRCLHSILNTSTLPTLRATCAFTCFNETPMPLVTQIVGSSDVVCSHQKTHHYIQNPNITGTLKIILPCECSLHQEELTLENTVLPCGSKNPVNYQITHLLPISWSKFHSITILPLESETRQEFQHLHEILDEHWTLSTPTYFVHNLQRQHHFQLNHDDKNIVNNTELILGSHADMKNWYSPIMMERFGRGVAMSWRVNNIKTEEQGGVEDGKPKSEEMLFNLTSDIDVPGQSRPFDELLSINEMDQEMLFNLTSDIDVPGQSRPFDELLSNHQMDQEMSRSFKEKILEEFLDMTKLARLF
ncbi:hypothetical protein J6590_056542 [Homalodisca vitripennis]|nr:hypothetical protein J6590_056542 [Homalodisca vitripennis]